MRVIAIGDIHGEFNKLNSLWNKLNITTQDKVIFLGDYIDRGEYQEETMNFILKLAQSDLNITFLRGNHELMMMQYFKDNNHDWIYNGGNETLAAFTKEPQLQDEFINFVSKTKYYKKLNLDNKDYIFCHAGIDTYLSLEEQDEETLVWIREEFFDFYEGKDIFVVGHTPTIFLNEQEQIHLKNYADKDFKPKYFNNIYFIDTGSYFEGGKITAFVYEDKKIDFIQA